jgi:hypothetical protein
MPRPPVAPPVHGVRPTFRTPAKDVRARLQAIQSRLQDLNQLPRNNTVSVSEARGALSSLAAPADPRARVVGTDRRAVSGLSENNSSSRSLTVDEMEKMFTSGLLRPLPTTVRSKLEIKNDIVGQKKTDVHDMDANKQHDETDQLSLTAAEMERMLYGEKTNSSSPKAAGSIPLTGSSWLRDHKNATLVPSAVPNRPVNKIESLKAVRSLKSGRALMLDMRSLMYSDGANNNNNTSNNSNVNVPGHVTEQHPNSTQLRGTAVLGRSPTSHVQDNIQSYISTYLNARPGDYTSPSPRMSNSMSPQHPSPRVPGGVSPSSRASQPPAPNLVPRPAHDSPFKRSKPLQDEDSRGSPRAPVFGSNPSSFGASTAITNTSSKPLQDDFAAPTQTARTVVLESPASIPRYTQRLDNNHTPTGSPIRSVQSRAFTLHSNLASMTPAHNIHNRPATLQALSPASDFPANISPNGGRSSATMFSSRHDLDSDSTSPVRGGDAVRSLTMVNEGNIGAITAVPNTSVAQPPALPPRLNDNQVADADAPAVALRAVSPRPAVMTADNMDNSAQGDGDVGQRMQQGHHDASVAEQHRTGSAHSNTPRNDFSSVREDVQLSD